MRAALARKAFVSVCLASASLVHAVPGFIPNALASPLLEHIEHIRANTGLQWCAPLDPSDAPIQAPSFSKASVRSSDTGDAATLFAYVLAEFSRRGTPTSAALVVEASSIPNAFIRREHTVVITTALAKSVHDNSELGFIFAHELAHITLGHAEGSSVSDELAADTLALKIIEALGLNPCAGADVLDRLSAPFSATLVSISPRLRALHESTVAGCDQAPLG